jgi:hypothetical protein
MPMENCSDIDCDFFHANGCMAKACWKLAQERGHCPTCGKMVAHIKTNELIFFCETCYALWDRTYLGQPILMHVPEFIRVRGCINCDAYKVHSYASYAKCVLFGCTSYGYSMNMRFIDPEEMIFITREGHPILIEGARKYVQRIQKRFGFIYQCLGIYLDSLMRGESMEKEQKETLKEHGNEMRDLLKQVEKDEKEAQEILDGFEKS